jgi:hypothetical protein
MARSITPYNLRLRSLDPLIEADASNLSIVLDGRGTAPGGATFSVRHTNDVFFSLRDVGKPGVALSATDAAWSFVNEPFMSFRTSADTERLRIDSNGVCCETLTASNFTNLIDDWVTPHQFVPPTAGALMNAYVSLSNMIVLRTQDGYAPPPDPDTTSTTPAASLIDSYTSTAVLQAPTANALRASYYNLSNLLGVRLLSITSALPGVLAQLAAGSNTSDVTFQPAQFQMSNDVWIPSLDGEPRLMFESSGPTVFGGAVDPGSGDVFRWFANGMQQRVMTLDADGNISVRHDARLGGSLYVPHGDASFCNDVYIGGTLNVSSMNVSRSNVVVFSSEEIRSNSTVYGDLNVGGAAFFGGFLTASNAAFLDSNLTVVGSTTLCNALDVSGIVSVSNAAFVDGSLTVTGATQLANVVDVYGVISASNAAFLDSNLTVTGVTSLSNAASVYGDMTADADLTVNGNLRLGPSVVISHVGDTIGVNLPPGTAPVCTLHVQGAVFTTEEIFGLSDSNVKTDVRPIPGALAKLGGITGCTYLRTDLPDAKRQVGVIAQDVQKVVPEAVHVDRDGRLSVAYGNLVAVAIQGINELKREVDALCARLDRMTAREHPHRRHRPRVARCKHTIRAPRYV